MELSISSSLDVKGFLINDLDINCGFVLLFLGNNEVSELVIQYLNCIGELYQGYNGQNLEEMIGEISNAELKLVELENLILYKMDPPESSQTEEI